MKSSIVSTPGRRATVFQSAVVMAALALAAPTLDAQTIYYVSPTGHDDNAGTIEAPFRTVQRGVDALQAPDFQHSKTIYPPGFEANSTEQDPWFESLSPDGTVGATDDFRLSEWSRLRNAGITLPSELLKLDRLVNPGETRDIGCCAHASAPLAVGVDGRQMFPPEP